MKTALHYISEVLGVDSPILPVPWQGPVSAEHTQDSSLSLETPAFFYSSAGAVESFQGHEPLVIVNWVREAHESIFRGEVRDLFQKMFSAMKIDSNQVLILDCVMNERNLIANELFKISSPKWVLFFGSEPIHAGEFQIKGPSRWLETFSPAVLVKNPQSKKIVWNDLQKIMREVQA